MAATPREQSWPHLPFGDWSDTCATLHLWTQIVGKIRLVQSPWINHYWQATLMEQLTRLGVPVDIHKKPNELAEAIPSGERSIWR